MPSQTVTLATAFVGDWGAEGQRRDRDTGEEVAAATDADALHDRQLADHRPPQPRVPGAPRQRVRLVRFELQDLAGPGPPQPRVGEVRAHRGDARGMRAAV